MQKQDRQNTEAAMKKGSDEHRIRGLQEQLDLKIRELLAVRFSAYYVEYFREEERLREGSK